MTPSLVVSPLLPLPSELLPGLEGDHLGIRLGYVLDIQIDQSFDHLSDHLIKQSFYQSIT